MVKFFETYGEFSNFDEEIFPCELVVSSHTFPNLGVKKFLGLFKELKKL